MFFNLNKEINRSRIEINRLLGKRMSNIYLKVTTETFSKLWFSGFKKFATMSVLGGLQLTQILLNFKTSCCNLKSGVWKQNCMWLFYYFDFKRCYNLLKLKSPCILLNKNIKVNKKETQSKMEILHTILERRTLFFSSNKNWKLKVILW